MVSHPGSALAVGPTHVIWLEPKMNAVSGPLGSVHAAPRCGGDSVKVADEQRYPVDVVLDGDKAFWTNLGTNTTGDVDNGVVMRASLGGFAKEMTVQEDGVPTGIAIDETDVYWSTDWYGIRRLPRDATTDFAQTIVDVSATAVAVDDTHVYWLDANGGVGRATKQGTAVEELNPSTCCYDESVGSIAIDASDVFVLDACGSLKRVAKSGGPAALITEGQPVQGAAAGHRIAIDDAHVYWLGDTSVLRAAKSGGPAQVVAPAGESPIGYRGGVALSETDVYWSAFQGIWRITKP
jgi:hypothetical protein